MGKATTELDVGNSFGSAAETHLTQCRAFVVRLVTAMNPVEALDDLRKELTPGTAFRLCDEIVLATKNRGADYRDDFSFDEKPPYLLFAQACQIIAEYDPKTTLPVCRAFMTILEHMKERHEAERLPGNFEPFPVLQQLIDLSSARPDFFVRQVVPVLHSYLMEPGARGIACDLGNFAVCNPKYRDSIISGIDTTMKLTRKSGPVAAMQADFLTKILAGLRAMPACASSPAFHIA